MQGGLLSGVAEETVPASQLSWFFESSRQLASILEDCEHRGQGTMIVYLLVRRKAQNVFLEADENDTVREIKLMLEGILKRSVPDQKLYHLQNDDLISEDSTQVMQDDSILSTYGISASSAKAHSPAKIGLVFRNESGNGYEQLDIEAYSNPPPLPDIMKPNASGDDSMNSKN